MTSMRRLPAGPIRIRKVLLSSDCPQICPKIFRGVQILTLTAMPLVSRRNTGAWTSRDNGAVDGFWGVGRRHCRAEPITDSERSHGRGSDLELVTTEWGGPLFRSRFSTKIQRITTMGHTHSRARCGTSRLRRRSSAAAAQDVPERIRYPIGAPPFFESRLTDSCEDDGHAAHVRGELPWRRIGIEPRRRHHRLRQSVGIPQKIEK